MGLVIATVRWRPILTVPALTPAWSTEWDGAGDLTYRRTLTTAAGAERYMATTTAIVDETEAPRTEYLQQFIATADLPAGLVHGDFRSAWVADVFTFSGTTPERYLRVIARVMDATGTVDRGIVFDGTTAGVTDGDDEIRVCGGPLTGEVVAEAGDILVVEVGGHVGGYVDNDDQTVRLIGYSPSTLIPDLPYEDGPSTTPQSAWVEIVLREPDPPLGIAYGYQLYARNPATRAEVWVDGLPMSGIAPWGDLHTATRLTGDWQINWSMIRHPRKQLQRHHALRVGAPVEVRLGPIVVAVGALTEPDWDSGELVALGAPREAEGALSLTAAGIMTTVPNTAVDEAIARGALNWTRGDDMGSTAIGVADGQGGLTSVARLLDALAEDVDNPSGWRINRRRVLRAVDDDDTDPEWYITPGAGELGVADDERADRVFVRYLVSGGGGALATASYPAATPAGGTERGADVTNRGPLTPTEAGKLAEGVWRKMQRGSGWANGLTVDRSQVTTPGGLPANLALIKAGDAMRLLGVSDPRGLAHHVDVVIGDTDYDWTAKTIQLNPVGLAARTFEAVIENESPGAVAL